MVLKYGFFSRQAHTSIPPKKTKKMRIEITPKTPTPPIALRTF